jgi:uncharacterized protein YicC (UPF0701 family)
MLLELTAEEGRDLTQVLDSALRELLEELAHTDTRSWRELLQARYERLESLARRLQAQLDSEQVYA